MSSIESASGKLEGVQVLRGMAAILVLWFHLKYNLGRNAAIFSGMPFLSTNWGAIGVDIFFVISGFVISMAAVKAAGNWRAFLAARVARILPLYFSVSALCLAGMILFRPGVISTQSIIDTFYFIPVLDGPGFTGPIVGNGWTLSFEMWFYLCFAVLLKLGFERRAWVVLPAFFMCGIAANLLFAWSGQWFLPKFLFHPMTLEFCAGCLLYHLRNRMGKWALYIMGGFGLLFFFLGYNQSSLGISWFIMDHLNAGLHRAVVWGGFAACLVGVITQVDLRYSWRWPRFLLLLGDASYSIYLVPAVFMIAFEIAIQQLNKFVGHDVTPSPVWYGSIYVFGSLAASIACWKLFEVPATRRARQFLSRFEMSGTLAHSSIASPTK